MTRFIATLALILLAVSNVIAQAGWRMDGFNPSRTNVSSATGPVSAPEFSVIASNVAGSLRRVGDDGSLILSDGSIVSSFTNSGQQRWRVEASASLGGAVVDVVIAASGVVYASSATSLIALDAVTGHALWPAPFVANSGNESGPLVIGQNGAIYFHTGSTIAGIQERYTAVNPDGTRKWEYVGNLGRAVGRSVFNNDGSITYLLQMRSGGASPAGNIVALSTASGERLFDTPCDPRGGVYTYTPWEVLYSGSVNNNLLEFPPNLQSCSVLASSVISTDTAAVTAAAAVSNGLLVVRAMVPASGESYAAIDSQARTLWSRTERLSSGFADANGTFFAIAPDRNDVIAIRIATGDELWRQRFSRPISGMALGGDGAVYLVAGGDLIRGAGRPAGRPSGASFAFSADGGVQSFLSALPGLIAAYTFDEGSGSAAVDASGNGFTGTLQNGSAWVAGNRGNAVSFDGFNDEVSLPNALDVSSVPFTLSVWVKPSNFDYWHAIFSKRAAYAPSLMRLDVGLSSGTGSVYVTSAAGFQTDLFVFNYAPPLNVWTHLGLVAEAGATKLYINGVLQQQLGPMALGTAANAPASIGRSGDDDDPFAGSIDDLRLYNRALSAAEVVTDMNTSIGGPSDTTAPSAAMTAPAGESTVSGAGVTVSADASDDVGVAGVQFLLNGAALGAEDTTAPYSISWNTTTAANGSYTLAARARDAAGNLTTSTPITVTVSNDTTAPVISGTGTSNITASGATISWTTDEPADTQVEYGTSTSYGQATVLNPSMLTTHQVNLTGLSPSTTHHYRVRSRDAAGNLALGADVVFNTTGIPDTTAPTVSMTAPAAGATVSGLGVTVSADASDNVGVAGVQFLLDGANLGTEDTAAPYSLTWDTTIVSDGSHTLAARARDAAGNTVVASGVTITVSNPPAPPTGLVAGYGFSEGNGSATADASGSGFTGTVSNGAAWVTGKNGAGISFDGVDDEVSLPSVLDISSLPLTLSAWIRPTSFASWGAIFSKRSAYAPSQMRFDLGLSQSTGQVYLTSSLGPGVSLITFNYAPPLNTWTHLALVAQSGGTSLYVNGVLQESQGVMGLGSGSSAAVSIGRSGDDDDTFTGIIDDFRLYSRALSAIEIQTDMDTQVGNGAVAFLTITQPQEGSAVASSTVQVNYTASGDLTEVNHVHFRLDGGPVLMDMSFDGVYQLTNVPVGSHVLTGYLVRADHSKILGTDDFVSFTTSVADAIPPSVNLAAPVGGSIVTGTIAVVATASDNVGVAGVQFLLDGQPLNSEDTSAPYSIQWNTTTAANGSHTLAARARDLAGNLTTSAPVTITVSNINPNDPAVKGQWSTPLNWPVVAVHSNLLSTGKVLVWDDSTFHPDNNHAGSAFVWDPITNAMTDVSNPSVNLFCGGPVQLADGRLMVVGGHISNDLGIPNASIFDPISQTWAAGAQMSYPRWYPSATTLGDGRVLVLLGTTTCLTCIASVPEIYNSVTNSWQQLTGATAGFTPYYPQTYVLPDGRVISATAAEYPINTRILDIATQTWSVMSPAPVTGLSVMYEPGKILRAGGSWDRGIGDPNTNSYVLEMSAASPSWRQIPSLEFPRVVHNLTILADGSVLSTGGQSDQHEPPPANAVVYAAELWSPQTETWTTMASMQTPRLYHSTALLLPDGRVLVSGGGRDSGYNLDQFNAEIYSPPYLFKGPRPAITAVPTQALHGASIFAATPDASRIVRASLVRLGSVTHAHNFDQRFVPLTFQQAPGGLQISIPGNPNLAPPGSYMLFIIDDLGVPSVASMIRLLGPSDTTAPVITGVGASSITPSGAAITWTTDELADTQVEYGTTTGYGQTTTLNPSMVTTHAANLTGLLPNTLYHYRVRSRDAASNLGLSGDSTFTTTSAPDTTAPTVAMTAPAAGATVMGSAVPVSANASDNVGVAGVQFLLDGADLGSEDTSAPYSISWNTTTIANGAHTLAARARDAAGNVTTSNPISVTVSNDTTAPVITGVGASNITAAGAAINWTTDELADTQVEYGTTTGYGQMTALNASMVTTHAANLTGLLPNTLYHYRVRSRDAASNLGLSGDSIFTTTNEPDTTAPAVAMTAPAAGATVTGSAVTVSANASDNVGVAGVQFLLDGADLGAEDTSSPYSMSWNTTTIANGSHTLTARARDAAGNVTTSNPITVTVSNTPPDTTAPVISGVGASNITSAGAAINWTTNEPADTQVEYGTTTSYGQTTALNPSMVTTHSASMTGLSANTLYHYRVRSRDAAGNLAISTDFTFTTLASVPGPLGLIAAYTFDEGLGSTTADASGSGFAGTLQNGAAWVAGNRGNAVSFDGFNDEVSLPNALDVSAVPFTLSVWVRPSDFNYWHAIFSKRAAYAPGQMRFDMGLSAGTGSVYLTSTAGFQTDLFVFNSAPQLNVWTHLGLVAEAGATKLYVNGVLQQQLGPMALGTGSTAPVSIGRSGDDDDPFAGRIDDLRLYNRALSAVEIVTDMNTALGTSTDTTAPTVSMTAPAPGATVTGSAVTVSANASDNVGVAGVQFLLDGADLGSEDTSAPYSMSWNTTTIANGAYTLAARARDAAGNVTSSSPISVTVSNDTTAPVITGVGASSITPSGATINWTTDELADTQVEYGATTGYGQTTTLNPSMVTTHAANLTGLLPNTLYHYRVRSRDAASNLGLSGDSTFTTTSAPDTTAPTVAMTAPAPGATVTGSAVTASANASDNVGVAGVQFLLDGADLGSEDTSAPYSMSWNTTTIANGAYTLAARARDAAGNVTSSSPISVTVSNDTTAPVITGVGASSITPSGATINWTTDELADTQVEYGTTTGYGQTTALNPSMVTAHTANLTGLFANTLYHYRVRSRDAASNLGLSGDSTFTTTSAPDTTAPTVAMTAPAPGATVTGSAVTASANASDNVGVAGVQFLLDGADLGSEDTSAPYSMSWNTTTIANGAYTLAARARDAAGNVTTSNPITVTVSNTPPDTTAPVISGVGASNITSAGAAINWTTNEPADTQVEYGTTTGYGQTTALNPSMVTAHAANLTGLFANTLYHYRVRSRDAAGNLAISTDSTFTTLNSGTGLPGLIAAYSFDEGTGSTTADVSGNGFTGTLQNGAAWVTGNRGNAVSFDGFNDEVSLPSALDVSAVPFTLSVWVRPSDFSYWHAIFSKRGAYAPSLMRFDVGLSSGTGNVYITSTAGFQTDLFVFNYAPPLNVWTHLAIVAEAGATKLYVNGVLQQQLSAVALGSGASRPVSIGRAGDDDDPFAGRIDDLRLYNRALSAAEVVIDMNN